MFKFIVEEDIELRLLDIRYSDELFNITNSSRDYLKKWLPWVEGTKTVNDTKVFIEMSKKQYFLDNGFQAAIFYKGKIAGIIGLHGVNWENKFTSIGYWLSDKYQGKGIMTKSCKAIIDYAFNELNMNRVEIRCADENYKSRAIPERLGFVREGTIREAEWLYDHFVNHIIYAAIRKEWI